MRVSSTSHGWSWAIPRRRRRWSFSMFARKLRTDSSHSAASCPAPRAWAALTGGPVNRLRNTARASSLPRLATAVGRTGRHGGCRWVQRSTSQLLPPRRLTSVSAASSTRSRAGGRVEYVFLTWTATRRRYTHHTERPGSQSPSMAARRSNRLGQRWRARPRPHTAQAIRTLMALASPTERSPRRRPRWTGRPPTAHLRPHHRPTRAPTLGPLRFRCGTTADRP